MLVLREGREGAERIACHVLSPRRLVNVMVEGRRRLAILRYLHLVTSSCHVTAGGSLTPMSTLTADWNSQPTSQAQVKFLISSDVDSRIDATVVGSSDTHRNRWEDAVTIEDATRG